MGRSRSISDSLRKAAEPRWLVVRDRFSRPLRHVMLAPGTDLRAALEAERTRLMREGWNVDEPTRYAFLFADKDNERVCVSIEVYEPGRMPVGHGSFIGRRSR
jgi:hypothetical protein